MLKEVEMLTERTIGSYLLDLGLLDATKGVQITELGGGVSNVVFSISTEEGGVVVKQALGKLRVPADWHAGRHRVLAEAEALRIASRITPGSVPEVLHVDTRRFAIVITRAPTQWQNWKQQLLAGDVAPDVAVELGRTLASWHVATLDDERVAKSLDDVEAFKELRLDPYYRAVMQRHSDVEALVASYVGRMRERRRCLVHGDFSPKNVLVGDNGIWVLDFEVAHFGDPAFDVAFMLNHLMLKSIHRPSTEQKYRTCALGFWDAYQSLASTTECAMDYVLGQAGCLMVARVDGKSPAEYLTTHEQAVARIVGLRLLSHPPPSLANAWNLIAEARS